MAWSVVLIACVSMLIVVTFRFTADNGAFWRVIVKFWTPIVELKPILRMSNWVYGIVMKLVEPEPFPTTNAETQSFWFTYDVKFPVHVTV